MSSFYEILEMPNGEIVLKRGDDEGPQEPLVTIRFSDESMAFLGANRFEVAKAMIEAGMDAVGELSEHNSEELAGEPEFERTLLH
jgi:hypothetical protein